MNITIIGYGKMGREIEEAALEKGHKIDLIIDLHNQDELTAEKLKDTQVAIEFTSPQSAPTNLIKCLQAGIPVVTGSTGWHKQFEEVATICRQKNGALFYASNFSLGVNVMFAVNEFLARIMDAFPQYEVKMTEIHHTQKLDAPSGTAISLAEQILKDLKRKKQWVHGDKQYPDAISIQAIREGDVKGIHEVIYESDIDYISLKHNAKTRKGFALGALMAAEFLQNKQGVYTMRDLLGI